MQILKQLPLKLSSPVWAYGIYSVKMHSHFHHLYLYTKLFLFQFPSWALPFLPSEILSIRGHIPPCLGSVFYFWFFWPDPMNKIHVYSFLSLLFLKLCISTSVWQHDGTISIKHDDIPWLIIILMVSYFLSYHFR